MNNRRIVTLAGTVFLSTFCFVASSRAQDTNGSQRGFVYTETNGANNAVLVFNRAADGSLSLAATVPTGGSGGGVVSVGSQGALALSHDGRWLFVANEGDGSISVMKRTPAGLQASGKFSSGGTLPVSITVSRNLVYVLNDGGNGSPASITGFFFADNRNLQRTGGGLPLEAPFAWLSLRTAKSE